MTRRTLETMPRMRLLLIVVGIVTLFFLCKFGAELALLRWALSYFI